MIFDPLDDDLVDVDYSLEDEFDMGYNESCPPYDEVPSTNREIEDLIEE